MSEKLPTSPRPLPVRAPSPPPALGWPARFRLFRWPRLGPRRQR